jgi:hypothetical protein
MMRNGWVQTSPVWEGSAPELPENGFLCFFQRVEEPGEVDLRIFDVLRGKAAHPDLVVEPKPA